MSARAALFLILLMPCLPLAAQLNTDGPIKMNPDLALAIPLVLIKHDVTVKYPILFNAGTVLKPGMTLRYLYVPPAPSESENLNMAHLGNMQQSFSRNTETADQQSQMSPELAHFLEGARREVWEVPLNFQLALAQLPTNSLHLIYLPTKDNRDLQDELIGFLDGLFLGSPTGGVSVLGVEIGSKAEQAGLKAGDQILAVGGKPVPTDLAAFPPLYFSVRKNAEDSHATSFPLTIRSANSPEERTVNMPTPATIKSMLMQEF